MRWDATAEMYLFILPALGREGPALASEHAKNDSFIPCFHARE
jgi:hypothetical protein